MDEALESDEAAASEYILRTASVLVTPSAWP
jgi:hypothetical protein